MAKMPYTENFVKEISQRGINLIQEILSEQYNGLTIERIAEFAKAQNGCKYCEKGSWKLIKVEDGPSGKAVESVFIFNSDADEKAALILDDHGLAMGFIDIDFCPMCGRKLK